MRAPYLAVSSEKQFLLFWSFAALWAAIALIALAVGVYALFR